MKIIFTFFVKAIELIVKMTAAPGVMLAATHLMFAKVQRGGLWTYT